MNRPDHWLTVCRLPIGPAARWNPAPRHPSTLIARPRPSDGKLQRKDSFLPDKTPRGSTLPPAAPPLLLSRRSDQSARSRSGLYLQMDAGADVCVWGGGGGEQLGEQ